MEKILGVYTFCNTGSVLVHEIDEFEEKVLASINGVNPEWCEMDWEFNEETGEDEQGFRFGKWFIPFCEVMRY